MMNKRLIIVITLILFLIASVVNLSAWLEFFLFPEEVVTATRWLFLAGFGFFALRHGTLTTWIFLGMAVGVEIGMDFPEYTENLKFLSTIFLRLIKTIIAPILFGTLVVGIAAHSNLKQVGRMGWKSLLYFEVITTIALVIGLVAINISKAGEGIIAPEALTKEIPLSPDRKNQKQIIDILEQSGIEVPDGLLNSLPDSIRDKTWQDHIIDIFPENFIKSVYEGNVLPIVLFSIIFGIALAQLPEDKKRPMLNFAESLSETMFKFVHIVMYFAPLGVGAAIAVTVGHLGIDILKNLLMLLFTLYIALIIFILIVFLPIALYIKLPVRKFIEAIKQPVTIAFATTSSDAALPLAMENMEKFGVPRKIVSFVIPTGYTFNLDGTTLYLSLAAIFVAQAHGLNLSFGEQLMIGLTLMLTSKGVAAVPRASLVILIATASTFDLPIWPIMAIYGIDELMDMARTSVNVTGNMLASCVVAKWEGEFDHDKALAFGEDE